MTTDKDMPDTPRPIDMEAGRRAFISTLGLGIAGAALFSPQSITPAAAQAITDADIANFALNLEYLEAEFYLRASTGRGLVDAEVSGVGTLGPVAGGRQVPFASRNIANFANEIASDERAHVRTLRSLLGNAAVARPAIDISFSFTLAARAAGLVGPNGTFDAYADDVSFLLAAFIFEDVGVTAYQGAAPLISDRTVLATAAGLLAVEAYHAGAIRTLLIERGLFAQGQAISNVRNAANPGTNSDQGLGDAVTSNIAPVNPPTGLTYARTPQQVLNIVYLNAEGRPTGFFPNGTNGRFR
jgi:hypothetical protein